MWHSWEMLTEHYDARQPVEIGSGWLNQYDAFAQI
jgi:hypothetical protein